MPQDLPDHAKLASSSPILSNNPPDSFLAAFQHWELVQAQLNQAIQQYLAASVALDAVCESVSPSCHCLTEKWYLKVNMELSNRSGEGELRKAWNVLARMRNRCRALSPISVLPSEVLVDILSLNSADECLRTCFTQFRSTSCPETPAWASVCTRWRQLYLRWHATSAHLDLVVGGDKEKRYFCRAEMIADRSLDAPLHLVIRDRVSKADCAVLSDEVARLIRFVTPLMPRVCALDITVENGSQLLLDSVLASWLEGCPRALPKVFKVWNSFAEEPLQLRPPIQLSSENQLSPTYFWDFLRPLQTLALHHCYPPSSSGIFKGLLDLYLDWSHKNPVPLDILNVLAASPGLRSLAIDDVACVKQEPPPKAVWLNSLQNLILSQYKIENCLNRFLPWLNTTSNLVSVIMRMIIDPDFIPESQAFFRRSSIKRIFTYGTERYSCTLVAQLCPAPDLEELVLRDCSLTVDPAGASSSSMADGSKYTHTPWPVLHTLRLVRCAIEHESLRQFIALHPIRRLRLYCCYLPQDSVHGDLRQMTARDCAELEEYFLGAGIDVKCVQHQ
ncbi:hypothetical protein FRC06_003745, partial [Ceratobasidium sp. 370]